MENRERYLSRAEIAMAIGAVMIVASLALKYMSEMVQPSQSGSSTQTDTATVTAANGTTVDTAEVPILLPPRMRGVTIYPNLTEESCQELKSWGVNSVRMMLMAPDLLDWQTKMVDPTKLANIEQQLDLCKRYGLSCILDVHELPGIVRWSAGFENDDSFWTSWHGHEVLLQAWEVLASTLARRGNELVAYELLNEPEPHRSVDQTDEGRRELAEELQQNVFRHFPESASQETRDSISRYVSQFRDSVGGKPSDWYLLAQRAITTIRQYDQRRYIVVDVQDSWTPAAFNRLNEGYRRLPETLYQLPLTDPADKLLVTFHFYLPLKYFWTNMGSRVEEDHFAPEFSYPSTFQDWGDDDQRNWNRDMLSETLEPVRRFVRATPGMRIIVSEFSVRKNADGAPQYLSDLVSLFEAEGWDWFYHVYGETAQYSRPGILFWDLKDTTNGHPGRLGALQEFWRQN